MCFSAAASFVIGGLTGATGVMALRRAESLREVPFASFPLLFASQQIVEGFIWLQLADAGGAGVCGPLTTTFVLYAEVLWPMLAALAVLLIEPDRLRRQILSLFAVAGTSLGLYFLIGILSDPYEAVILGDSIRYDGGSAPASAFAAVYFLVTAVPLLISSHRAVRDFGLAVAIGFAAASYLYYSTFVSVWCFFAAGASVLVYRHFALARPAAAGGGARGG